MKRTAILALLLVAPLMTGCIGLGGDEDAGSGLETKSRAEVTADTGGIEGIVTDSAVQPLQDATVEIRETGETTQTAEDGSFAFSNLQPATYTVEISSDGFVSTEKSVPVTSGEVAPVEVVLAHEPTLTPYSQQFQFNGFLECSAAFPSATHDTTGIYAVAVCSVPNVALSLLGGGNATNDRFLFYKEIEENPWQVTSELTWEPANQFAGRMSLAVEAAGYPNNNSATLLESAGENPLVLTADRATITSLTGNLSQACQTGDDNACNRNYVEDGGRLQWRVFVDAPPMEPGVAVQQDYSLINTIFYNAPACDDFSVVEDNQCSQEDAPPQTDPYQGSGTGNRTGSGR